MREPAWRTRNPWRLAVSILRRKSSAKLTTTATTTTTLCASVFESVAHFVCAQSLFRDAYILFQRTNWTAAPVYEMRSRAFTHWSGECVRLYYEDLFVFFFSLSLSLSLSLGGGFCGFPPCARSVAAATNTKAGRDRRSAIVYARCAPHRPHSVSTKGDTPIVKTHDTDTHTHANNHGPVISPV